MSASSHLSHYCWASPQSQLMHITWFHVIMARLRTIFQPWWKAAPQQEKPGGGVGGWVGGLKGHLSRFRELQGLWNEMGAGGLPVVSILLYCATICLWKQTALAPNSHDQRAATPALNNGAAAAHITPVVGCESATFGWIGEHGAGSAEGRIKCQLWNRPPALRLDCRSIKGPAWRQIHLTNFLTVTFLRRVNDY